jgi:polyphosphate kinase 2
MSLLPRAHLFEFNDRDWVPASLRDTLIETLSRSLDWGGFVRPLVPVMDDFLSTAGTREVLELCSGAAGTWDALISTSRVYAQRDLLQLVSPFGGGYEWTYDTHDDPFGGRGCYFQGVPSEARPFSRANEPTPATARRIMDEEQTNPEAAAQGHNGAEALPTAPEVNAKRQEATVELQHEVESLEQTSTAPEDPLAASTMKKKALRRYLREQTLKPYQAELIKMQQYLEESGTRMVILFEGRDAAGKGGTIRRVTRYMNEKHYRVVALGKPTEHERTQWFFQKYVQHFPRAGEVVLFDRSWYNRAMVEPVFGFCSEKDYKNFMRGVTGFEKDLVRQGTVLIKLYFSVTQDEQKRRFERRKADPLRQWKLSEVDVQAQERWDEFTNVKYEMLKRTHTTHAPWKIIRSNDKHKARLNAIKVILNSVPYERMDESLDFVPDSDIVISGSRELEKMEAQRLRAGKFLV